MAWIGGILFSENGKSETEEGQSWRWHPLELSPKALWPLCMKLTQPLTHLLATFVKNVTYKNLWLYLNAIKVAAPHLMLWVILWTRISTLTTSRSSTILTHSPEPDPTQLLILPHMPSHLIQEPFLHSKTSGHLSIQL